jgi:hypothetical protein
MRQETVVKTYLKFSELTEKQKEKVLCKNYDINVDGDYWYEHLKDEFETKLKKLGFYKIQIQFSGFSSQGDGASFSAKHRRGNIETSGRYCHSNTMRSDNDLILVVGKRLADKYYKALLEEYVYQTSTQAIVEAIEANDMEFDEDTI